MSASDRELLRDEWRKVATELKIQFVSPFFLSLPDGTQCEFAAMLPQFGSINGMIIDTQYLNHCFSAAYSAGYGISILDPEQNHTHQNMQGYIERLIDWKWVGPGASPEWYMSAA